MSVATCDPSERQVVIAGPGAGKTHVVARLVENLIIDEGVDPVNGLLVLSFSNAAVHAVHARLKAHDVPPVQVRTIDSLAGLILRRYAEDDATSSSFEARVARATDLLRTGEWDDGEDIEHVVVDEVQDVVGVRADFVLALLASIPKEAGMTLLGDPAQAIYDFQLAEEGGGTPSSELLDQVRADGARTVFLRGQYRARSRDAVAAAGLRTSGADTADPNDVEDFWNEVIPLGSAGEAWDVLATRSGTKAFLTGTNGHALLVASALRDMGLKVTLHRGAQQQCLAAWIALVFASPAASLARDEFRDLLSHIAPEVDTAVAWQALRSVVSGRGTEIDKVALASSLRARFSFAPELLSIPDADVVVSTVHRAKGLEFDHVALVEDLSPGQSRTAEMESRGRFVALTRARDLLLRVPGPSDRMVRLHKPPPPAGARWIRGGPQKWQTLAFEMRMGDIDGDVDGDLGVTGAAGMLDVKYLVGRSARLTPDPVLSTLERPIYRVEIDGQSVSVTTEAFGTDLVSRIGGLERRRRGWPTLTNAYIEDVATFADESLRFRLVPVLSGLADIEWSDSGGE
ncbi:UvrD-helicase domain-containing protein [Nocardioides oleivorans]|uniref:UvrD-helicase domain-containing protein n=1 Tax=Nocardioides oleivorans TaxID=273676 RepID=UPI0023DDC67B|nr:UvrD-helicase domain-containing protein [Nocardioides oleivorans]